MSSQTLEKIKALEMALHCTVCYYLLEDPLLLVNCGHTVCKQCYAKQSKMSKNCPVCDSLVVNRGSVEDRQFKDMLLHLKSMKSILQNEAESNDITPCQPNGVNNEENDAKEPVKGPTCSTPKISRTSSLAKASALLSSCDDSIVQETPENRINKTPVPANEARRPVNKKLSTSASSTNNSTLSPMGNINKKNHKGETLLHRAVIKNDVTKVTDLLKEGASVNTQDNNGWTPLHEACHYGFVEIAKLLLDHGALVNVPSTKDNVTPLHDAILNNHVSIAVLLVSRGADLNAKDSSGQTALSMCKTDEDHRILTEACSPFIDARTITPDSKGSVNKADKLIFLSSNLQENQKEQLKKCALMLKAAIVEDFTPEVTHIITSCDKMGNCTRTMKILRGILSGKWIMNYQWIEVCLEYKKKIDEEVFEVQGTKIQPNTQGPKRGRQNYEQKFPPLFDGFFFYLHGPFNKPTPEKEDICNLVTLGGGKILTREPRPDTVTSDGFLMPYHASGTLLEDTSHVILFQEKPPRDVHVRSGHIATTQVMWLIACISEFKLLDFKQLNPEKK